MNDTLKVYTFTLIDGRKVSYEGLTEGQAFNRANLYHPHAVMTNGTPAQPCRCPSKSAGAPRQGGWLICTECAGYIA